MPRSRYNALGIDLNRNFPDPYTSPNNTPDGRATETAVIMNWCFGRSFTASANFHGGALVANYPFDNNASGASIYTPTPDDDLFIWMSEEYSQHNLPMWNSPVFYHGITNGAAWYAISGGMQDWNYHYMGGNEVTIELSNNKQPPASEIDTFWNDNRDAMLAYLETCLVGVRGIVTDADTGLPLQATVTVVGRDHEVYTDPDLGDYHRMLLPGSYDLRFQADGYDSMQVSSVVVNAGDATRLDLAMNLPPQIAWPNGGETLTEGVPIDITWAGSPAARFQVQYTDNFGDSNLVPDDFERTGLGSDYPTGGDRTWYITTDSSHGGLRSARAGLITHNQSSWLERQADGGALSFWYRVSSEANYDFFNFYVDGDQKLHLSGTVSWTWYSTTLPPGAHTLRWEYVKDYSVSGGSDTAWIDDLTFTVDNTIWTDVIALTAPGAASTPWTPPAPGADYKVRVRAVYGGGIYGDWDESDGTFSVQAAPGLPGDFDGDDDVDLNDFATFADCYHGSAVTVPPPSCPQPQFEACDLDGDSDVDLGDFSTFANNYTG